MPKAPSKCLSKSKIMDKWDDFKNRPKDFFFHVYVLIFNCFFRYETIVRSSAWSFGNSDPDPSSVSRELAICRAVLAFYLHGSVIFTFHSFFFLTHLLGVET